MKRTALRLMLGAAACLLLPGAYAQNNRNNEEPIRLVNPSFEDSPGHSHTPRGWYDCGAVSFPKESPPDVQPSSWEVKKMAYQGDTYLGMVVRDNDTWESVGQRLSRPIEKGHCYQFSMYLCRSELYVSLSRVTGREENYTTPAKVRIWGGNGVCSKKELLAESSLITNTRWLEYNFDLKPKQTHEFIVLEAFYNTPVLFPYNGNVLLDNASAITPVPCEDEKKTLAEAPKDKPKPIKQPVPKPKTDSAATSRSATPPKQEAPRKETKILVDLDKKKIKEGQTIRIDKLYFDADSSTIKPASFAVLDEIYQFLSDNTGISIEIGGHTNNIPPDDYCDRLSSARAKAVADYLIAKGIGEDRIQYKGYGKRMPLSSNALPEGRRRNQRVEIKILSLKNG